ncbi:WUSCHEL-related homeobox 8-like [Vigna angularis]|uniref:WUSCHEL-related homeobox 8-like n=1 Tax=Phaseolus angularis TaxID=3914 RepID=UPI0022B3C83E|nr:WUSCHEL-related homeobox 8-like [Vigna angularis]
MDMEAKTVHKRWRSTPKQVRILLNIYNHGIINPSRDQVREITGRLQEYGEVEEYSVYCWFQNHGNRVKNRGWQQSIPGKPGSSFTLLPPFMYDPSWVIPRTPELLDLFPIPVIHKEEKKVTPPMPFRTQAPSTELSLRLSLADQ